MGIKSFQPPDDLPVTENTNYGTRIHPRWSRFFTLLQDNSNSGANLGDELSDQITGRLVPAISRLRGLCASIWAYLFERPIQTPTADLQLQEIDSGADVDASGGAVTITLPDAEKVRDRKYFVRKSDSSSNAVTVNTLLYQTINGDTSAMLALQNTSVGFRSDGSNWVIA